MRHCVAFLLLALAAARPADAQTVPVAKIDEFVRAEMARQKIPGVAIAVVEIAAVVKIDGYGFANVEHKVPVTPATISPAPTNAGIVKNHGEANRPSIVPMNARPPAPICTCRCSSIG